MSDHEVESAKRALASDRRIYYPADAYWAATVANLKAEGWTPPPPPKPVLEVSDAAWMAHCNYGGYKSGLAAAFTVILRDQLEKQVTPVAPGAPVYCPPLYFTRTPAVSASIPITQLYRALTGEEWPDAR